MILTCSASSLAFADNKTIEHISIFGSKENLEKQAGSAYRLDEDDLDTFQYQDINRVLKDIPGVNIQEEDGFGLRPNIGFRGAHPHRSRKITLLEDGVLLGPAPYSAPAAYYFPMMYRIGTVEVFKGPSSVRFGPNSIGGALNLITRPIPDQFTYGFRGEVGTFETYKGEFDVGGTYDNISFILNGARIESDGFKELPDDDAPTGFRRDDLQLKLRYDLNPQHSFELKTVRAHEKSNETYLGLTEEDFERNPYERYAASAKDDMAWTRNQIMLTHVYDGELFSGTTKVYRYWFHRNWSKFNGFGDSNVVPLDVILRPDGSNLLFLSILKGEEDTSSTNDRVIIGDNDRSYVSEGVQWDGQIPLELSWSDNSELSLGLRHHKDEIKRNHTEQAYLMQDGSLLLAQDSAQVSTNRTFDSSVSNSLYFNLRQDFSAISWTIGGRFEAIADERKDPLASESTSIKRDDELTVFGTGLSWQISQPWLVFAGVNQGITVVGPGQLDSVKPEESLNYELGLRFRKGSFNADAVAFLSDYSNIKGTCSFSSGCSGSNLDQEFNGGEALIQGLELMIQNQNNIGPLSLRQGLAYTYTQAEFASDTVSDNPEWGIGDINSGDPLPYLSNHNLALQLSADWHSYEAVASYQYKSKMFDQTVDEDRREIPSYSVVDLSFAKYISMNAKVFLRAENVLDEVYQVSLRPYGLRPGKPRLLSIGFNWKNL